METIIIKIKDASKSTYIKNFLKKKDYLLVKENKEFSSDEKKMIAKFTKAFKEVDDFEQGKIKLKPAAQFLKEMRQ